MWPLWASTSLYTAFILATASIPLLYLDSRSQKIYLGVAIPLLTCVCAFVNYILISRPLTKLLERIDTTLEQRHVTEAHQRTVLKKATQVANAQIAAATAAAATGSQGHTLPPAGGTTAGSSPSISLQYGLKNQERLIEEIGVGSYHSEMFSLQCQVKDLFKSLLVEQQQLYTLQVESIQHDAAVKTAALMPNPNNTKNNAGPPSLSVLATVNGAAAERPKNIGASPSERRVQSTRASRSSEKNNTGMVGISSSAAARSRDRGGKDRGGGPPSQRNPSPPSTTAVSGRPSSSKEHGYLDIQSNTSNTSGVSPVPQPPSGHRLAGVSYAHTAVLVPEDDDAEYASCGSSVELEDVVVSAQPLGPPEAAKRLTRKLQLLSNEEESGGKGGSDGLHQLGRVEQMGLSPPVRVASYDRSPSALVPSPVPPSTLRSSSSGTLLPSNTNAELDRRRSSSTIVAVATAVVLQRGARFRGDHRDVCLFMTSSKSGESKIVLYKGQLEQPMLGTGMQAGLNIEKPLDGFALDLDERSVARRRKAGKLEDRVELSYFDTSYGYGLKVERSTADTGKWKVLLSALKSRALMLQVETVNLKDDTENSSQVAEVATPTAVPTIRVTLEKIPCILERVHIYHHGATSLRKWNPLGDGIHSVELTGWSIATGDKVIEVVEAK